METLKSLQTHKSKLESKLTKQKFERTEISQQVSKTEQQIKFIEYKISAFKEKELRVSEHAILRYLERKEGIDIKEIKEKILSPWVRTCHEQLGSGKFPLKDNDLKAIIKDNVVVTIE